MNTPARSYRDLIVWQKAIDLVAEIYKATYTFPDREKYALSSQMRRAAVSIPSNIAEGRSRSTRKDFINFPHTALGSGTELETQLIIGKRLGYLQHPDFETTTALLSEVCRMLHGMIKKLEAGS
jgi:four helix bundle protein